ncbi:MULTISPECIES: DUF1492 domain-containing protein [Peptoniphilaceae]|uniref:DUF1492 domain-containing protein n=2 Tax=Peptoniphilaceae TaxID=1570339 RepID=A0A6N2UVU8_9FIRM|nr:MULTISPECIES: DUF1492 domain-containing protein [Peptoniphilaceae]MBS4882994.1 DUF1492 domain-containing protein [Peptoniphilus harei]MBS5945073.1 DUF1492 domain-containing protein [Peptoniphilus harei]MDK7355182.1 DUF1492 domain-containing protein [Peptoniphilus harei]MDK7370706.1 DUF1492 domain-containing protein [Peptoniphilus harei]MDK7376415.1 DUF1492 domain-containing protein [Peptoniphilus harei]
MNAKEYLKQAFYLDKRINSKLEQVESLNALATKATSTLSDMPKSPNRGSSKLEDTIVKIIDLQEEINRDIDKLVDLKKEIVRTIKKIEDKELQVVLEKRYLCFESWEKIAVEMNYSIQHIFRLHSKALKNIEI